MITISAHHKQDKVEIELAHVVAGMDIEQAETFAMMVLRAVDGAKAWQKVNGTEVERARFVPAFTSKRGKVVAP